MKLLANAQCNQVKEGKETPVAECEVRSEDQAFGSGVILSLPGKALLGLHERAEKPVTHIIPTSGIFAHLLFEEFEESGEPCGAIPLKGLVEGNLVVEDCEEPKSQEEKSVHLIVEEKALSSLTIFEKPVTLDGSATVFLANNALLERLTEIDN